MSESDRAVDPYVFGVWPSKFQEVSHPRKQRWVDQAQSSVEVDDADDTRSSRIPIRKPPVGYEMLRLVAFSGDARAIAGRTAS